MISATLVIDEHGTCTLRGREDDGSIVEQVISRSQARRMAEAVREMVEGGRGEVQAWGDGWCWMDVDRLLSLTPDRDCDPTHCAERFTAKYGKDGALEYIVIDGKECWRRLT